MARIRIIQNCAFLPICLAIIIGCCVPFLLFEGIDPPFPDIDYISEEDYVPGVPAAEKSRLDLANEKFDLCCRQAGLCFQCRYGVSPPMTWCALDKLGAYLSCANDGEDNSQCCRDKGVDSGGFWLLNWDCANICTPEYFPKVPGYGVCHEEGNAKKIRECMVAAYDGNRQTASERYDRCVNTEICVSKMQAKH